MADCWQPQAGKSLPIVGGRSGCARGNDGRSSVDDNAEPRAARMWTAGCGARLINQSGLLRGWRLIRFDV